MYCYDDWSQYQDRDIELNNSPPVDYLLKVLEFEVENIDFCDLGTNASIIQSISSVTNTETTMSRSDLPNSHFQDKLVADMIHVNVQTHTNVAKDKKIIKFPVQTNPLIKKVDDSFADFVGMSHVKEEVYRQASFIKIQQMRKAQNIPMAGSPSRHMVFTGNPGTGKTTVARIVADVYCSLGILENNTVVETDRSGLIAEYMGQTAIKTRDVIESALGGVLFIDEAYSLTEQEQKDYGNEAIDVLVKMMEDHRDELVVIVAGYGAEMHRFVSSNPGLQSRFNRYLDFPNYSEEELWEILLKLCKTNSYIIQDTSVVKLALIQEFRVQVHQQGKQFGNARYVRNIFEKAIENQSYRLILSNMSDRIDLQVLKACDFLLECA